MARRDNSNKVSGATGKKLQKCRSVSEYTLGPKAFTHDMVEKQTTHTHTHTHTRIQTHTYSYYRTL